ncbi:MAG: hypothetical protein LLG05_05190 [Porphyromonadaceae bacterium]|nr:hypothetical protein [Porphyromonadaceae bacterium]
MKDNEFYRPANIEFNCGHDGSNMPETFGTFETAEEMAKFLQGNLTAINQSLTVMRHMDNKEKKELQDQYSDLLENIVPIYEKKLIESELALVSAKKELKDAEERYQSEIAKVKDLATEKKRGLREMCLDDKYTFRIPYSGNYYFYTWIDKKLRLCLVRPIPDIEKQDLYNAMGGNEAFIDKNFGSVPDKKGK